MLLDLVVEVVKDGLGLQGGLGELSRYVFEVRFEFASNGKERVLDVDFLVYGGSRGFPLGKEVPEFLALMVGGDDGIGGFFLGVGGGSDNER